MMQGAETERRPALSRRRLSILFALGVVLLVAAGGRYVLNRSEPTSEKLAAELGPAGSGATCAKVGVIALAGARSTLYRCSWMTADRNGFPVDHARCGVWIDGLAYDVTARARAAAKLTGSQRLC